MSATTGKKVITICRQKVSDRYRKYAEAKSRIPKNLSAEEYERRVKALAKKYKI